MGHLSVMPALPLLGIISNLPLKEQAAARRVCKHWYHTLANHQKTLYLEIGGTKWKPEPLLEWDHPNYEKVLIDLGLLYRDEPPPDETNTLVISPERFTCNWASQVGQAFPSLVSLNVINGKQRGDPEDFFPPLQVIVHCLADTLNSLKIIYKPLQRSRDEYQTVPNSISQAFFAVLASCSKLTTLWLHLEFVQFNSGPLAKRDLRYETGPIDFPLIRQLVDFRFINCFSASSDTNILWHSIWRYFSPQVTQRIIYYTNYEMVTLEFLESPLAPLSLFQHIIWGASLFDYYIPAPRVIPADPPLPVNSQAVDWYDRFTVRYASLRILCVSFNQETVASLTFRQFLFYLSRLSSLRFLTLNRIDMETFSERNSADVTRGLPALCSVRALRLSFLNNASLDDLALLGVALFAPNVHILTIEFYGQVACPLCDTWYDFGETPPSVSAKMLPSFRRFFKPLLQLTALHSIQISVASNKCRVWQWEHLREIIEKNERIQGKCSQCNESGV